MVEAAGVETSRPIAETCAETHKTWASIGDCAFDLADEESGSDLNPHETARFLSLTVPKAKHAGHPFQNRPPLLLNPMLDLTVHAPRQHPRLSVIELPAQSVSAMSSSCFCASVRWP